jgi:hypothetical protein
MVDTTVAVTLCDKPFFGMKSSSIVGTAVCVCTCVSCNPTSSKVESSAIDSARITTPVIVAQEQPRIDTTHSPLEALTCTPKTLHSGDTITLRMRTPHGGYLAVVQPDGTFYFIVYPQLGDPTRRFSKIPSDTFKKMPLLLLPSDLRAAPRVYGRDTLLEPVFSKVGSYQIHLGENLESDYAPPVSKCRIRVLLSKK